MKTNKNAGNTVRRTYELPKSICEALEKSAENNMRSINFELINILQEYFNSDFVKLEPHTKKIIDDHAKRHGSSFSWAANYLLADGIRHEEEAVEKRKESAKA